MNASDQHADLFPSNNDASSENSFGEMRFRADDLTDSGPAADAASDMGARLKAAREARGMDLQSCGQALRLPIRVLARLEAGDFGKADDHVFTRGALQSYARLLGLPGFAVEAALRVTAPSQQPVLIPTGNALRGNWLQRYGAAATYIVLTAFVAVPLVWLGLRGGLDNQLTRIAPLMASMTPFPAMNLASDATAQPASAPAAAAPVAAGPDHVLTLEVHGDSWVEVTDAGGKTLESGMLHAGDTRSYHSSAALSVTLGNADAVAVQSDGKPLSLDAYRHANVARFRVFASGESNG